MMDEFGNMSGQVLDLLFSIRIPSRYAFDKYLFSKFDDRVCRYIFFWLYDTTFVAGNLFRQIINERYNNNLINDPKKDALILLSIDTANTFVGQGGYGFLSPLSNQQSGILLGIPSIILFFVSFGFGFREKIRLTSFLLVAGGALLAVSKIV